MVIRNKHAFTRVDVTTNSGEGIFFVGKGAWVSGQDTESGFTQKECARKTVFWGGETVF
ncbi:hypothetical protein DSLASN_32380 [Desulfoluna limicola]|uniref:Uncharacterized protein n=1 Tax=Desulfoluna limicola TaxID=2810562 RepID=A0ABM7PJW1_9BACT|nr:hypothetical protein [Desulfoluna limicola]BCS97606.1 hypothetical protein DSLASN_32380 [Desulfoluna limicola]